jgi:hypothetical protein
MLKEFHLKAGAPSEQQLAATESFGLDPSHVRITPLKRNHQDCATRSAVIIHDRTRRFSCTILDNFTGGGSAVLGVGLLYCIVIQAQIDITCASINSECTYLIEPMEFGTESGESDNRVTTWTHPLRGSQRTIHRGFLTLSISSLYLIVFKQAR